jgi:hypothetical protein
MDSVLQNSVTKSYIYIGDVEMEALGAMSFVFGMMGVVAFVRTQKLIKTLKENGVLDKDYKSE